MHRSTFVVRPLSKGSSKAEFRGTDSPPSWLRPGSEALPRVPVCTGLHGHGLLILTLLFHDWRPACRVWCQNHQYTMHVREYSRARTDQAVIFRSRGSPHPPFSCSASVVLAIDRTSGSLAKVTNRHGRRKACSPADRRSRL